MVIRGQVSLNYWDYIVFPMISNGDNLSSSDSYLSIGPSLLLAQICQVDIIVEEHIVGGFYMVNFFRFMVLESDMVSPELILLNLSLVSISAAWSLTLMAFMPLFAC